MATKKNTSQKSRGKKSAKATGSRRSGAKSKSGSEAKVSAKSSESDAEGRGGPNGKKRRSRSVKTVPFRRKAPRKFIRSGDLQGLPAFADVSTESVSELVDEGQSFEAGFVSGVEEASAADLSEVKTREVPEDDVPPEYDDQDTIG